MEPPPVTYPPPKEAKGCFAAGCLTVVIALIVLAVILAVGGWFLYGKAVNLFTSPQPVEIAIIGSTDADFRAAQDKLNRLRQATANSQETRIEFSAAELNALIARDPNFAGIRNRAHIAISDSLFDLQLSASLNSIPLPKLKGRWFNGRARFGFGVVLGQFVFNPKSLEANGHALPQGFLNTFGPSFNKSFNESFQRELQKNPQGSTFWTRIKTIELEADKLVVTTHGS